MLVAGNDIKTIRHIVASLMECKQNVNTRKQTKTIISNFIKETNLLIQKLNGGGGGSLDKEVESTTISGEFF